MNCAVAITVRRSGRPYLNHQSIFNWLGRLATSMAKRINVTMCLIARSAPVLLSVGRDTK